MMSKLHKLICIKLAAGGFDTDLLQKMAKAKEEQLTVRKQKDLLYEQLLKEQEEKRRAQEAENRAREAERETMHGSSKRSKDSKGNKG